MKRLFNYFLIIVLCIIFIPLVEAKTIDHFYADAGESILFEDDVNGSGALAGDNIEFKGNIHGINFMAGNNLEHNGSSDYLVLAGNIITISGMVSNDVVLAGNIIDIKDNAGLERDVLIFGSDVTIKGKINRNVTVYGGKVLVSGCSIGGNVKIYAEEIKVDDNVLIDGKLYYPKDADVNISSNVDKLVKMSSIEKNSSSLFITSLLEKIWSFMSILFIFAIMSLLVPKIFEKINADYEVVDFNKGLSVFTKGLLFLMLVPFVAVLLLIVPFGIPLSLILLVLYFIIIYLSKIFVGYLLGFKLWQYLFKKDTNILLVGIIGYLLLFILDLIPGIDVLTSLLSMLFGIGIIFKLLLDARKG